MLSDHSRKKNLHNFVLFYIHIYIGFFMSSCVLEKKTDNIKSSLSMDIFFFYQITISTNVILAVSLKLQFSST